MLLKLVLGCFLFWKVLLWGLQIIPNRIALIFRGRYDEAVVSSNIYPGMIGQFNTSTTPAQIAPHAVPGGAGQWGIMLEDALRGGDITQVLTANYVAPFRRPAKGDEYLCLLQNGQNVTNNQGLMSAGDGTLVANPGNPLYEIVAPSATLSTFTAETTFSNGSYAFPANFLQVNDRYHARVKTQCLGVTSTPTFTVKLYFGSATAVVSSGAISQISGDTITIDAYITIRTITSSGTFVADGTLVTEASGTFTTTSFTLVSTTLDSTVAETVKVTAACSASSASNQIALEEFEINLDRGAGLNTLVVSNEAINNSGGTGTGPNSAAYIRVLVP